MNLIIFKYTSELSLDFEIPGDFQIMEMTYASMFPRFLIVNVLSMELKILKQQLELRRAHVNLFLPTKFVNTIHKPNMS